MFKIRKKGLFLAGFLLLAILLVACQPEEVVVEVPVEVTRVVTETITEEGETVEVTRVVTEEMVVTATPEPEVEEPMMGGAPDPATFTWLTIGDPDTLDPNLNYETSGFTIIQNVAEPLIWYNGSDPTTYVPVLATEVPSVDNGLISEDGLSYTFNIREGVTFHDGGTLEPHDVAYTFQRGLLQSDPNGPQWLWLEPILGYASGDVTEEIADGEYAGDPEALRANASPEELIATCEKVKAAVVADDDAGTVTINLAQPWGPMLATTAGFSYVIDQEWAVEQGSWDGDCATWQNWYAPGSENSELTDKLNGTGPYVLDHWTVGEELVLTANPNYWRAEGDAMWEGGPSGLPRIQTVIRRSVDEWGTRFAAMQAGDAERIYVPEANRPQIDAFVGEFCDWRTLECETNPDNPDGPFQKWGSLPTVSRTDVFMSFNTGEDSPYIGSGQLDGNGIPPDFFNDINVRRAMNYCFDYETYITDVQNGEGFRNNGPIILDMLGYNPDGEMYEYDLAKCEEELAQAWGGVLPETGFRFSVAFNTGNTTRQSVAAILQSNLSSINPAYQVDIVGLPWPTFLRSFRTGQVPMLASGWIEDIHDPHNWVQPFTVGTYAGRQNLPDELKAQFQDLVTAGVLAPTPEEREQVYFELQQLHHDQAIQITLSQSAGALYYQRWMDDYYWRPGEFGPFWYAYSLDEG